jgi:hypothetical protein
MNKVLHISKFKFSFDISNSTAMMLVNNLPAKNEIELAFKNVDAKRIPKRNDQYIVTVSIADFMKANEIADSFGQVNSVAMQQVVKINIA